MAQQTIGIGTTANDDTGDTLRAAGGKINDNFNELYAADAAVAAAWTAWVPTVSATTPAGSGFAATITYARKKRQIDNTVHLSFEIIVTNLGTGPSASGSLTVTAPHNPAFATCGGSGREDAVSGNVLVAQIATDGIMTVYPASALATDARFRFSVTYEAAA